MKIIEGLHRLKIIRKQMDHNRKDLLKYASGLNSEIPAFTTDVKQKAEVSKLIQSNNDLMKEYLEIKRRIDKTNLNTVVLFDGINYTLSDLLVFKRTMAKEMVDTYESLNNSAASQRFRNVTVGADGNKVAIVLYYSEEQRNENLKIWRNMSDNINSRLEVINATTDLQ